MKTDDLTKEDFRLLDFGLNMHLSGKLGKFVFFQLNGKTHARRAPGKRDPGSWSEKQLANRNRFAAMTSHARGLKQTIIEPIWNKAAKQKKMSGYNLFIRANNPAFDATGQVPDPRFLHFAAGTLALPRHLSATVEPGNPRSVSVKWANDGFWKDSPYHDDCLMSVTYPQETIEVVDTGFTRKDEKASLEIPVTAAKEVFLFLFFWNKMRNTYSPDQVFKLK